MSLETTKTLLGVDNEKVEIIYDQVEKRLRARLRRDLPDLVQIPPDLEFVVQEVAIVRYNRIGSEGLQMEGMDGYTATYLDTDLSVFESDIAEYIRLEIGDGPQEGKVRFI